MGAMAGTHLSVVRPKNGKASGSMVAQMQLLLDRKICVILFRIFSLHRLREGEGLRTSFGPLLGMF